jgi:hypothetical protein
VRGGLQADLGEPRDGVLPALRHLFDLLEDERVVIVGECSARNERKECEQRVSFHGTLLKLRIFQEQSRRGSPKHQSPNPKEISSSKFQNTDRLRSNLVLGNWGFLGALGFGIWCLAELAFTLTVLNESYAAFHEDERGGKRFRYDRQSCR